MPTSTDLPRQHLCTQELDIDAPASAVWEVLADFNNAYLWAPSVSHSYGLTDAERCVGAARRCTVEGFGTIDEHITEWTEGRGFTFTVTNPCVRLLCCPVGLQCTLHTHGHEPRRDFKAEPKGAAKCE